MQRNAIQNSIHDVMMIPFHSHYYKSILMTFEYTCVITAYYNRRHKNTNENKIMIYNLGQREANRHRRLP